MTASLPMYETAPMQAALDRFWNSVRSIYGQGPSQLDRHTDPHTTWVDPNLLLSQTCGLPYRTELYDKVQLVGTPDYGVADCPPGFYCSHLVVRADDHRQTLGAFSGARLARNDVRSQSGWAAVLAHIDQHAPDLALSCDYLDTGSHKNSLLAVRGQNADIAGVDAVTWALLARDTHATDGLRVLTSTRPTPGLPFITGPKHDPQALRAALSDSIRTMTTEDRRLLMLRDIVWIAPETYRSVPTPSK